MSSSGLNHDDDGSYDSEEERHQARLFYGGRERSLQQERARQATLLQGFQARKRSLQQLEEDLLRWRLRGEGWGQAGAHASEQGWGGSGADGQRGVATESLPLAALREHEKRWKLLEAAAVTAPGLTTADIPWPPVECPTAYLQGLVRLELHLASTPVGREPHMGSRPLENGGSRAARRAYAKACLRWHPDKFQHRLGRALVEGEAEGILARVQGISQGINRAWEEVQREWEGV